MSIPAPEITEHPGVCSANIRFHVTDRLRDGEINLYSASLLAHEALRLERQCFVQPAWKRQVRISSLLAFFLDHLTAKAFGSDAEAAESAAWFVECVPLLQEKRPHFLTSRMTGTGEALLADRGFYEQLADLRSRFDTLSDDDGPYPQEVFPYYFAAPESELLVPGSQPAFQGGRELDDLSAEIYIKLQTR